MTRHPFAARLVLPVACAELAVQVALANGYGYHRDELYFRTAARNPAFGYDDQPPLTPLLGWGSEALFGETPRGLRVVSAVAVALVVVLVALLARELGAAGKGQLLAATATAGATYVVVVGHLLSTSTFDLLAWTAIVYLVARILGGADARLWLAVGVVVGVALQNKHLPLLLVASLAAGMLLDGRLVPILRSRWVWIGAFLALVIWLPNLVWQTTNGWPQLELAGDIRVDEASSSRAALLPLQLVLVGPLLLPLIAAGWWSLVRAGSVRSWRALALAYPIQLALVFVLAGKPYYPAALLVCLLAPGAVVAERWATTFTRTAVLGTAIASTALFSIVLALPVVPVSRLQSTPIPDINEDAAETVGWPELVRTVADVFERLPAAERRTAVVFTGNYGEAGAVDRFGPALGLPRAYSGHNAYARFGQPPSPARPVIVLGYRDPSRDFVGCELVATIDNGVGLQNGEQNGSVFLCDGPRKPWREAWSSLRHLDA